MEDYEVYRRLSEREKDVLVGGEANYSQGHARRWDHFLVRRRGALALSHELMRRQVPRYLWI